MYWLSLAMVSILVYTSLEWGDKCPLGSLYVFNVLYK